MTTETTSAPTAAPKQGGKRKLLLGGGALILLAIGFALGSSGGNSTAAATAPAPTPVTVTAPAVTAPAPAAVTVTAPAPAAVTVTADAPAPVTVTAEPAAPKAGTGADDPKANGKFLLGSQINSGTWQCSEAKKIGTGSSEMEMAYWEVTAQDNSIVHNGNDTIAVIGDEGYTVTLSGLRHDLDEGLMRQTVTEMETETVQVPDTTYAQCLVTQMDRLGDAFTEQLAAYVGLVEAQKRGYANEPSILEKAKQLSDEATQLAQDSNDEAAQCGREAQVRANS